LFAKRVSKFTPKDFIGMAPGGVVGRIFLVDVMNSLKHYLWGCI
jgi:hypothetical protein